MCTQIVGLFFPGKLIAFHQSAMLLLSFVVECNAMGGGRGGSGGGSGGGGRGGGEGGGISFDTIIAIAVFSSICLLGVIYNRCVDEHTRVKVAKCNRNCRLVETSVRTLRALDGSYNEIWTCDSCNEEFYCLEDTMILHCHSCKLDFCEDCSMIRLQPTVMCDSTIRPHLSSNGTQLMMPLAAAIFQTRSTRVSPNGALCKKQMRELESVLNAHNMAIISIEDARNLKDGDENSRQPVSS